MKMIRTHDRRVRVRVRRKDFGLRILAPDTRIVRHVELLRHTCIGRCEVYSLLSLAAWTSTKNSNADIHTFLKYGNMPFQSHVELAPPSCFQISYSSLVPRRKTCPLTFEPPPTTFPMPTQNARLLSADCGTEVRLKTREELIPSNGNPFWLSEEIHEWIPEQWKGSMADLPSFPCSRTSTESVQNR